MRLTGLVVLITLAWGTALGYFVSVSFMMKYGWGSHAWDITLAELVEYNKVKLPLPEPSCLIEAVPFSHNLDLHVESDPYEAFHPIRSPSHQPV